MVINPFTGDGYSMATLTAAIEKVPFVPGRIAEMGLFTNEGVGTTAVLIEEKDRVLSLAKNLPRGSQPGTTPPEVRKMRTLSCTHLPVDDYVAADDLLNLREFGSESAQASLASRVNGKLTNLKQVLAATLEWMRMGALHGVIYDGSKTLVYNLFTEFDIPTPATHDFILGTTTTDIRGVCMDVNTAIYEAVGNRPINHVHAFCGATFYKRLTGHAEVVDILKYFDPSQLIRDPNIRGFEFGEIIWEPYRGKVGGVGYVDTNKCRFFPVGTPGIFPTYYAPSTWLESVGTMGTPLYAKQIPTADNSGIKLLAQSNPLPLCLIPNCLREGSSSN